MVFSERPRKRRTGKDLVKSKRPLARKSKTEFQQVPEGLRQKRITDSESPNPPAFAQPCLSRSNFRVSQRGSRERCLPFFPELKRRKKRTKKEEGTRKISRNGKQRKETERNGKKERHGNKRKRHHFDDPLSETATRSNRPHSHRGNGQPYRNKRTQICNPLAGDACLLDLINPGCANSGGLFLGAPRITA